MVEVDEIFKGTDCKTKIFASNRVINDLYDQSKNPHRKKFRKCLERYAKNGFEHYSDKKSPIRREYGVYRIGIVGDLFRVYGFFTNNDKKEFIALDSFMKKKTRLSASEIKRIKEVACKKENAREKALWKKRFHSED